MHTPRRNFLIAAAVGALGLGERGRDLSGHHGSTQVRPSPPARGTNEAVGAGSSK